MALYAPTPPTPPSPPSPPRIVLGQGGSVHESTVPQSHGPKTGDEINEEAARSAVAHGAGTLSKTTVGEPETNTKAEKSKPVQKQTADTSTTGHAGATSRTAAPATEARTLTDNTAVETQRQMALAGKQAFVQQDVATAPFADENDGHGVVYWIFSLVAIVVLVVVAFRTFVYRKPEPTVAKTDRPLTSPSADWQAPIPPEPAQTLVKTNSTVSSRFEVRV